MLEFLAQRPSPLDYSFWHISPAAANSVAAPIRRERGGREIAVRTGSTPDCTMTWRNARRACLYRHTLSILTATHNRICSYDNDNGTLSGYVMPNAVESSTINDTAPPPAPTPERVPASSSVYVWPVRSNVLPLLAIHPFFFAQF